VLEVFFESILTQACLVPIAEWSADARVPRVGLGGSAASIGLSMRFSRKP
jgi:hypothetical protein